MLKVDRNGANIEIAGDSEVLKKEIGTLMLALCGEAAKQYKEAALDIYEHYMKTLVVIASYLKGKYQIDVKKFLEEQEEPNEKPKTPPSVSKDLDDAIEQFFASLDKIIEKKKGDK
jgi:hypothetical protein